MLLQQKKIIIWCSLKKKCFLLNHFCRLKDDTWLKIKKQPSRLIWIDPPACSSETLPLKVQSSESQQRSKLRSKDRPWQAVIDHQDLFWKIEGTSFWKKHETGSGIFVTMVLWTSCVCRIYSRYHGHTSAALYLTVLMFYSWVVL